GACISWRTAWNQKIMRSILSLANLPLRREPRKQDLTPWAVDPTIEAGDFRIRPVSPLRFSLIDLKRSGGPAAPRQRVVIVGVSSRAIPRSVSEEHLDELGRLVESAGGEVVARVVQERGAPDPAPAVGRGGRVIPRRAWAAELSTRSVRPPGPSTRSSSCSTTSSPPRRFGTSRSAGGRRSRRAPARGGSSTCAPPTRGRARRARR